MTSRSLPYRSLKRPAVPQARCPFTLEQLENRQFLAGTPIAVSLANDTGTSGDDRLTSAASIIVELGEPQRVTSLLAWTDGVRARDAVDVATQLDPSGALTLDDAALASIQGAPLEDGRRSLRLKALDENGRAIGRTKFTFRLDRQGPAIDIRAPGASISLLSRLSGRARDDGGIATAGYHFEGVPMTEPLVVSRRGTFDSGIVLAGVVGANQQLVVTATDAAGNLASVAVPVTIDVTPLPGLNFGPFIGRGESPGNTTLSAAELEARMKPFAGYAQWLRVYSTTGSLAAAAEIADRLGFKTAVTAFLSADSAANRLELDGLIAAANAGDVDLAIVGSEVLQRGDMSPQDLIAAIAEVRAAIPSSIPVATADTYHQLLNHPEVIAAGDVVLANIFGYFEGLDVDAALQALPGIYANLQVAAGDRPVMVSESGWPTAGRRIGDAVPSPANAARYLLGFTSFLKTTGIDGFHFQAADEPWKSSVEGSQGAHWGLWDGSLRFKKELLRFGGADVFAGAIDDTLWAGNLIDGPGTPAVQFTSVPAIGQTAPLAGRVSHVLPGVHSIAVYIKVAGGWWTKPTFDRPATPIDNTGAWTANIVTGGLDAEATEVRAYLVPIGYDIPLVGGLSDLPSELEAFPSVISVRGT